MKQCTICDAVLDALKAVTPQSITHHLNGESACLQMINDMRYRIDRLKAENAELLAENKQLKHLVADPAREVDIQAVCADVIDRQINHHGYTNTDYCHFCGVRLCYGEAHRHDCSVLIAMDLQTKSAIAKAQGGS